MRSVWSIRFCIYGMWSIYNLWLLVYMFPDETAQAGLDIKAKKI